MSREIFRFFPLTAPAPPYALILACSANVAVFDGFFWPLPIYVDEKISEYYNSKERKR